MNTYDDFDAENIDGVKELIDFANPIKIESLVYYKDKSTFEVPQYVALLNPERPKPHGWYLMRQPSEFEAFILAHGVGVMRKLCTVQALLDKRIEVYKCKRRVWRLMMETKRFTPVLVCSMKGKKGMKLIEDPSIDTEKKISYNFRPHGLMVENETGDGF